ncbi:MAG TPA: proton-conducting transporter membrane subunit [Woeseiaceae bacterium]|nr:proton-conducting transporter membrane subunit [Woeseiaceae bacterium]
MNSAWLTATAVATPLIAAAAILLARKHPNLREALSLLGALALFAQVAALLPDVLAGARPQLAVLEILHGLELGFQVEPLGLLFALIASFLWFVTVVYSIGYMRTHGELHQTRFYAYFALAISATIGGAFSADLLTLYLFYEALTFATYPLVTHGGKETDRAGGRTYLMILLGTSLIFLLLALVWTYSLTGTLSFTEGGLLANGDGLRPGVTPTIMMVLYALFLFGTGKAALLPFHRWLPAAMVAPTPVSALLHAVAVVKLGVFTILKITVYTFGAGTLVRFDAGEIMQYVAAATLLVAAVLALREDNLKRRLAYSTVSQLGYIVLAATLANRYALLAGGMHILAHALAKITLFFCAGTILISLHKTAVTDLNGIGRVMPITVGAWIVASFCVIGLPLTGGFWSKWYLVQGALEAGQPILVAVVLLGSLLAVCYLLPPAVRALYLTPVQATAARPAFGAEAPRTSLIAIGVTAALCVLLFFVAQPIVSLLDGFAG